MAVKPLMSANRIVARRRSRRSALVVPVVLALGAERRLEERAEQKARRVPGAPGQQDRERLLGDGLGRDPRDQRPALARSEGLEPDLLGAPPLEQPARQLRSGRGDR